jgi:hypothetical protein
MRLLHASKHCDTFALHAASASEQIDVQIGWSPAGFIPWLVAQAVAQSSTPF